MLKDSVLNFYKSISSASGSALVELLENMEKRVSEWIKFRCECIAEHVANVKRLVEDLGEDIQLGLYTFTPSLSRLVGQDYEKLCHYVDFLSPMLYRRGDGVACINFELHRIAYELLSHDEGISEEQLINSLFDALNLRGKRPKDLQALKAGIDDQTILSELEEARELAESKAYPILMLDDARLARLAGQVGDMGIPCMSLFMCRDDLKHNIAACAKAWCR